VTPIPRTTQALASILTGLYPHNHRVRTLFDHLPGEVRLVSELARSAGYRTIAVVSNHVLTAERGLDRGFEIYDSASDAREAAATTEAAIAHLRELDATDDVFLWVHYIDPHVPYFPPRDLAVAFDPDYRDRYRYSFGETKGGVGDNAYPRDLPKADAVYRNPLPDRVNAHVRRLYAADVRATDDAIARLVTWLRDEFGEGWLIVFTSDHGESLGEHAFHFDHGDYVYNAGLRVPLGIVPPSSRPFKRSEPVEDWVSLVDLGPTLAELLELEPPPSDGRSLVPYLRGEALAPRPVFGECGKSYYPTLVRRRQSFDVSGRFRSVIDEGWKLIWTPGLPDTQAFELYDLERDPRETQDLYAPDHPRASRLRQLLFEWIRDTPGTVAQPSAEDLERLRSLGYVD
jgi:arylsulfatase A-like enzyme